MKLISKTETVMSKQISWPLLPVVQIELVCFMSDISDIAHFGQSCKDICDAILNTKDGSFWKRLYQQQNIVVTWNVPKSIYSSLLNYNFPDHDDDNDTNSTKIGLSYKDHMKQLRQCEHSDYKSSILVSQPSENSDENRRNPKNTFKINADKRSEMIYYDENGKSYPQWHVKRPDNRANGFHLSRVMMVSTKEYNYNYTIVRDEMYNKYICYNIKDKGKIMWQWYHRSATRSVILNKKHNLLVCLDVNEANSMKDRMLICLDAISGKIIWEKNVLIDTRVTGHFGIIDDDFIVYNTVRYDDKSIKCCIIFDLHNGNVLSILDGRINGTQSIKRMIDTVNVEYYYFFGETYMYQYTRNNHKQAKTKEDNNISSDDNNNETIKQNKKCDNFTIGDVFKNWKNDMNEFKKIREVKVCPDYLSFVGGGEIVELMDDSIILIQYGRICDSGVLVTKVKLNNLKIVWETKLKPAGVSHSEYYHSVEVRYIGRKGLRIKSIGSSATWCENVNMNTGESFDRTGEDFNSLPPWL